MKIETKSQKFSRLLKREEEETKRIAKELHHDLTQSLSAINFDLGEVVQQVKGDQIRTGIENLEGVRLQIQEIIKRVQGIGMHLWPPTLDDMGILDTISWFCREFQETHSGIQIKTHIDIQENEVPDFLRYVIYKMLQAALDDVVRYSKTDLVDLFLVKGNTTIDLTVQDNGQGFDMEKEALMGSGLSLSLDSLRRRAEIAGGSCAIDSAIGKGTTIRASLPMEPFRPAVRGEENMVAYEFYWRDESEKEHVIGILRERRKNPERISDESIINWGRKILGTNGDTKNIYFIKVDV
jgi:signal transduction histidine kinase